MEQARRFYDRWTPIMVESAGTTLQCGLVKRSAEAAVTPESSTQFLAELAGIAPGDRILDAGCGVGGPAMAIARALPDVVGRRRFSSNAPAVDHDMVCSMSHPARLSNVSKLLNTGEASSCLRS